MCVGIGLKLSGRWCFSIYAVFRLNSKLNSKLRMTFTCDSHFPKGMQICVICWKKRRKKEWSIETLRAQQKKKLNWEWGWKYHETQNNGCFLALIKYWQHYKWTWGENLNAKVHCELFKITNISVYCNPLNVICF